MPQPTVPRPRLRMTRRGRLLRSALALVLFLLLILALVALLRSVGGGEGASADPAPSAAVRHGEASPAPSDGAAAAAAPVEASGTPEVEGDGSAEAPEMVQTGTEGEGTWQFAPPADSTAPEGATLRTYAVRIEDGIGIGVEDASQEIAQILADPRGWQDLEGVAFQQVGSSEEAEFTISVGSPPTVDALCLPARTGGIWSCRVGAEVALNSDRWLHATPTYSDLAEYRAYLVNHEVGHFLGHGHASCPGAEQPAPVMLQQSMDLEGCTPNAWPASDA